MTPENLVMHLNDGTAWIPEAMEEMMNTIRELWNYVDPQIAERYVSTQSIRMAEALCGLTGHYVDS